VRGIGLAVLLAALLGAGCGSEDESGAGAAPTQTIEVTESEFEVSTASAELEDAGSYAFRVRNNGSMEHALEVEGEGLEEETDTIAPGGSGDLAVTLEPGVYELYCPIGDHRERGMKATLTVGGGSGGTTTGEEDEDGGRDYGY
jgi:plastocyanin